SPRQAWPMLLIEKLRPISPNFRVINASASGSTTEGGLGRLASHLKNRIDIFVLELGVNDIFRGIPVEQTRANLQSIIDRVKARNQIVAVLILGMKIQFAAPGRESVTSFGKMSTDLAGKKHAWHGPYFVE